MLSRCFIAALLVLLSVGVCMAVDDSQRVKTLADEITGLNRLAGVSIEVESFTLPENDDTPIRLFKEHLVTGSLWKISYKVDSLQHANKVNPHIVGFDVYADVSTGQVLKVVSRDDPAIPEQYQTGIEISNKEIASILTEDMYVIQDRLPAVVPTFKFADMIMGNGVTARHYECYYFLFQHRSIDGGQIVPAWLVILYGTEPIRSLGPVEHRPSRHLPLAERYRRTFEIQMLDAKSGELLLRGSSVGSNDDTADQN